MLSFQHSSFNFQCKQPCIQTGAGLWPQYDDIEFRGAAFPIGGDATIDGLVTVPNILREFTHHNQLLGVSHGMGLRDQLPTHQLNVAVSGSSSASMPEQARYGLDTGRVVSMGMQYCRSVRW